MPIKILIFLYPQKFLSKAQKSQQLHDTVGLQLPLNSNQSLQLNETLDARGKVSGLNENILSGDILDKHKKALAETKAF